MLQIKYKTTRECRRDVDLMKAINLYTRFEKFPDAVDFSGTWTRETISSFLYQNYSFETVELGVKAKNAYYQKVSRLKKRIAYILTSSEESYFITLTFRDDVLASTSEETRRKYVRRFLKEKCQGGHYVANIDYGKRTEREHYHAVANFSAAGWPYGHQLSRRVELYAPLSAKYDHLPEEEYREKAFEVCKKRLSKYVAKLGFHAVKETTKDAYLIYSRIPKEEPSEPVVAVKAPELIPITDQGIIDAFEKAIQLAKLRQVCAADLKPR